MNKTLFSFCVILITSTLVINAKVFGDEPKKAGSATLSIQPELPLAKDNNEMFKHVIVYKEPGRFCGWPGTKGIWNWDNEILTGFRISYYKENKRKGHDRDRDKPSQNVLIRSMDGGETWKLEEAKHFLAPSFKRDKEQPRCPEKINFMHPDFAMSGHSSFFYYSYDRGRNWKGPYTLSTGQKGTNTMGARNEYIVNGTHDCFVFITFTKNMKTRKQGQRPVCIRTTDGGRTWNLVSWMAPKTAGYSIMPSTVRLSKNLFISTIRRQEKPRNFIDAYYSGDNGKTWRFLNRVGSTGSNNGNPPSMIKLKDGRIVVTYGYRSEPYGIRAKISSDGGRTWGREIHLRDDGREWDLGYPRTIQRPDGKIVTVYYFTTKENPEQHIAATIWDPDKISSKSNEKIEETTPNYIPKKATPDGISFSEKEKIKLTTLQQEPEKDLATIGVQANWPYEIRRMTENSLVYVNRKNEFKEVPDFLKGLDYTLQYRKRIMNISCHVKDSGMLYLGLFGNVTPKQIGQQGTWEKCGTLKVSGLDKNQSMTLYKTYGQKDEIFIFSQRDTFGLTVFGKEITKDKTRPLPKMPTVANAQKHIAGKSVEGRPIEYLVFGSGNDVILIMAAIHGHEQLGIPLVHRLAEYLQEHQNLLEGRKVILMPIANPDGVAKFRRFNAHGVDLNRNFESGNRRNGNRNGPHALSEPEARAIHEVIEKYSPDRIVSIHQMMGWTIGSKHPPGMVDYDGPGETLAHHIAQFCKLRVERWGSEPGSLGSYVGIELDIPIVSPELSKFDFDLGSERLWKKYGTALIASIVYPDKAR